MAVISETRAYLAKPFVIPYLLAYNHSKTILILFIDLKNAYDNVKRVNKNYR